jgi:hypothetical protein
MEETKMRYLEMIQGIINRMAANSFALKTWAVTLMAGICVLSEKGSNRLYILVAFVPIILFWILDSYYLQLERKYRNFYNQARKLEPKDIDFNLALSKKELTEKTDENDEQDRNTNFLNVMFTSPSTIIFYLPAALLLAAIIIVLIIFQ